MVTEEFLSDDDDDDDDNDDDNDDVSGDPFECVFAKFADVLRKGDDSLIQPLFLEPIERLPDWIKYMVPDVVSI